MFPHFGSAGIYTLRWCEYFFSFKRQCLTRWMMRAFCCSATLAAASKRNRQPGNRILETGPCVLSGCLADESAPLRAEFLVSFSSLKRGRCNVCASFSFGFQRERKKKTIWSLLSFFTIFAGSRDRPGDKDRPTLISSSSSLERENKPAKGHQKPSNNFPLACCWPFYLTVVQ